MHFNRASPLVTIIAICYNHEKYVEQTINSIRSQTYPNVELIIIDSNSSDNSVKVIQHLITTQNIDCKFIVQKSPHNICQNINAGLQLCGGKYYQVISCDDTFFPDKTATQVEIFESLSGEYGLIYSDVSICDGDGIVQTDSLYKEKGLNQPPTGYVYVEQAQNNFIKAMTMMVRYEAASSIGFYDENLSFEDVDFFLRLSEKYKFFFQNTVTGVWRRHGMNMTNDLYSNSAYLNSRLLAYAKHINRANPKVTKILLPKIKRLLVMLHKTSSISLDKPHLEVLLQNYDRFFRLMINNIVPYQVYFMVGIHQMIILKVRLAVSVFLKHIKAR